MQQKKLSHYPFVSVLILLVFLTCFVSNASAISMQFLKYSPAASFTAEDFKMLQETGKKAVDDNADGKTSSWKNSQSGNSGSITPLDSSTIDGNHCRRVKFINRAKENYSESTFTFCKINNLWKVIK